MVGAPSGYSHRLGEGLLTIDSGMVSDLPLG
jgi:hypothetical protein